MSSELNRFARRVDGFLEDRSIHLTMGGEPTFVSADPEGAEWNTAAIGPEKLGYARRMAARLVASEYPGALVMQVFGKLYPGEPLPRWNLLILHAAEAALWPATDRLLLDDRQGDNTARAAGRLIDALADALLPSAQALPVAEQAAPGRTVGWVLPLDRVDGAWVSDDWPVNPDGHVELVEGDSPVGLRLPLSDLPEESLRRALSVEVYKGGLEVFLPPLEMEGFVTLIAEIRALVEQLGLDDLLFCGYPPSDAEDEFVICGIASDPGVVEVNLPACDSWAAYDRILRRSHQAAAGEGLMLTKLQLNGAVSGTGGGSHLTFGGPAADRNPFLQDTSRIASLLRYWQHHPSLSYLFSGQFVGPGCQAPRIDEGPLHGLHELEVACEGLERIEGPVAEEVVDHYLRHLATDSAGNTHRAEICFDKFGNAAAPNGRMGIIELRAFETFDDIEIMSAVALFARTVLARLFKAPFEKALQRFGPQLHDRYFLPAFLWRDLEAICEDLREHELPFDPDWLRPVLDFRCPVIATLTTPAGPIEIRQALESWPLLAEESTGTSTVRVVDNSTDRLQISLPNVDMLEQGTFLISGVEPRWERVGERLVAGVRYKCASAYPALHPHVAVQSPLSFEWLDSRGTVRAAAWYHYWNPDQPTYARRPANAREARQRREDRWRPAPERIGAKPAAKSATTSPEFWATLDLRRNAPA